jgi:hypothetical protein
MIPADELEVRAVYTFIATWRQKFALSEVAISCLAQPASSSQQSNFDFAQFLFFQLKSNMILKIPSSSLVRVYELHIKYQNEEL